MSDDGAPLRVLIADDHSAIRAGVRFILQSAPGIEVVGEAADGAAAVTNAVALRPDVVLMDVRMPGMDGIAATRTIVRDGLAQVLILTTFDVDEYVLGAVRAGAAGYLLKTAEPSELLEAVRRVGAGDAVLAPEATRRLLDAYVALARDGAERVGVERDGAECDGAAFNSTSGTNAGAINSTRLREASGADDALTERETEVLGLLAEGLSNRDISARLHISAGTTKTHVSRVLAKLGCTSRTQAALIAREEGLV